MATSAQAASHVRDEYHRIWNDWFGPGPPATPAQLDIRAGDGSTGYSYNENRLVVCICDGNLDDFDLWPGGQRSPVSYLGWYVNQRELVHELLQEYQNKRISSASDEGRRLYERYGHTFLGPGHDERFFSAIAETAGYFGVSAEERMAELWAPDVCKTLALSGIAAP